MTVRIISCYEITVGYVFWYVIVEEMFED